MSQTTLCCQETAPAGEEERNVNGWKSFAGNEAGVTKEEDALRFTYPVQPCTVLSSGTVVAVQRVESLPEWRLVDGGMQHLWGQRVTPGILSVIQL